MVMFLYMRTQGTAFVHYFQIIVWKILLSVSTPDTIVMYEIDKRNARKINMTVGIV